MLLRFLLLLLSLALAVPTSLTACTAKIVPFQPTCDGGCASEPADGATGDGPASTRDPVDTTIVGVRDPSAPARPAPGTIVRITGAVVTAVKSAGTNHGFFVQQPGAKTYAGIFVFVAAATVSVAPGAVVTVTGGYKVFRELDEIDASISGGSYEQTAAGPVPAATDVALAALVDPARAAETESMLVRIGNVTVATAPVGTDFTVTDGTTQLTVTSFVANDIGPGFTVRTGDPFTQIFGLGYVTGPEGGPYATKIAPRSSADLKR